MRRAKTPAWVLELKKVRDTTQYAPTLADLIGVIEVRCDQCQRHGRYRADRLMAELGNLHLPEVPTAIAKRGGCSRALNPPHISSSVYSASLCAIRFVHDVREGR